MSAVVSIRPSLRFPPTPAPESAGQGPIAPIVPFALGPTTQPRARSRSALACARLPGVADLLANCSLCLHGCGDDRSQRASGRCHAGPRASLFSAQTDVSDELELVPAFAISLSGCDLRCDFCITGGPSWNASAGLPLDPQRLGFQVRQALDRGTRHVMILGGEPTIHPTSLLELVANLPDEARLVLKTNACFSAALRPWLAELFDVWLPDFKFGNPACAERLARIPPPVDYWGTVTSNLLWMARDAGPSELVVRHLLMPGHVDCCWEPIARWLARNLPDTKTSLRSGYWPAWHAHRHHELRRPLPKPELDRATRMAVDLGLRLVP